MTISIHPARLDQTAHIVEQFKRRIGVWQRIDTDGHVADVPYESLTLYERWMHGGAWMSIETGAIHLNHLLLGGGIALTAIDEASGRVVGYLEAYPGVEPAPIGSILHIAHLASEPGAQSIEDALIAAITAEAKALKCQGITLTRFAEDALSMAAARRAALVTMGCVRRYMVASRAGQVFYRATEQTSADPALINGWAMPIGRLTSARQMWESLMPRTFDTIPEIRERKLHRMKINAAGQDAYVVLQQGLYNPRSADVSCWTPKPLTAQLLASIRDWAHREGYRALSLVVTDADVKLLGADVEADGYSQETCALELA